MRIRSVAAIPVLALGLAACPTTTGEIQARTAKAWSCPEEQITVSLINGAHRTAGMAGRRYALYCARGCGHERVVAYVIASTALESRTHGATYTAFERYVMLPDACPTVSVDVLNP
jgi:hypothetical protein